MSEYWLPSFVEIPEEKWTEFQVKAMKAKGKVIVLVHPYFDLSWQGSEKYLETVNKIIGQSKTPVIVLQEYKNTKHLADNLPKGKKPSLVFSTEFDSGYLVLKYESPRLQGHSIDEDMKYFSAKLNSLGVKTILIGGMFATEPQSRSNPHGKNQKPMSEPNVNNLKEIEAYETSWLTRRGIAKPAEHQFQSHSLINNCTGYVYRQLILSKMFQNIRFIPNATVDKQRRMHKHPYSRPKSPHIHRV